MRRDGEIIIMLVRSERAIFSPLCPPVCPVWTGSLSRVLGPADCPGCPFIAANCTERERGEREESVKPGLDMVLSVCLLSIIIFISPSLLILLAGL